MIRLLKPSADWQESSELDPYRRHLLCNKCASDEDAALSFCGAWTQPGVTTLQYIQGDECIECLGEYQRGWKCSGCSTTYLYSDVH